MRHGSLFSGIGGFDLAAEWMGWENVFHCEINEFCQKILKYHWPKSISHADIKQTDFTIYRGRIDVLSGGFPCQPYSTAGKRKGKADDRHLWPDMLRAIREVQPRYVVGENVRGITNWNGGMVFDEVQDDLEVEGYEVLPFLLPACGKEAPHRRDRIWFIAYSASRQNNRWGSGGFHAESSRVDVKRDVTNSDGGECAPWMCEGKRENKTETRTGLDNRFTGPGYNEPGAWERFPTQSPVCSGNDGLPRELDGITFPKWRNESLKAYGNAVVPQVVYQIFKAIEEYDRLSIP